MSPAERLLLDLTKPLNESTEIYSDGAYSDPAFAVRPWCTVADQGFSVSSLALGTQTGTHIDAPCHFVEGGAPLEALDVGHLIGPFFHVNPNQISDPAARAQALRRYGGESILLVVAGAAQAQLSVDALADLVGLGCKVWAVAGTIVVRDQEPLFFHRRLAESGIFLIEDLDEQASGTAPTSGTMVALPLRLEGVSGSPCRVAVLEDDL